MKNSIVIEGTILALIALASSAAGARTDEWIAVGPRGGRVAAIAVSPRGCDTLYVSCGALYRSVDGGLEWEKIVTIGAPGEIVLDPANPSILYAVVDAKLYKSVDAAATWTPLVSPVREIAIDPRNMSTIYAGGAYDGRIFKSRDGGATWSELNTGSVWAIGAIAVSPRDSNTVFAGTVGDWDFSGDGVFKSTDGGATWLPASAGLPGSTISALIFDPLCPDTIYAGTWGVGFYWGEGVFRSVDGGSSWEPARGGMLDYESIDALEAVAGQRGVLYAGTGRGLFRTDDAGTNWHEVDLRVEEYEVNEIGTCPQGCGAVYIGSYYGLLKMTPGSEKARLLGFDPVGINAMVFDPFDPGVLYAGGRTVYKRAGSCGRWELANLGLMCMGNDMAIDPRNCNVLYAGAYSSGQGACKSTNGGATWNRMLHPFAVSDIEIDPHGCETLYIGGLRSVVKSTDGGSSWTGISGSTTLCITVDPARPGTLYIGTMHEGIKKSVDGGATWSDINNGLPVEDQYFYIHTIAVDPFDSDILYCGTYQSGAFKSMDGGGHWIEANVGLTTSDIRKIAIDPARPSILYAGSLRHGVFRSVNGARSWEPLEAGWPGGSVMDLVLDPAGSNVIYACGSAGMLRYESSFNPATDAGGSGRGGLPAMIVYGTVIEYSIAAPSRVRLAAYNVAGQRVAILADRLHEAGRHSVDIAGRRLGSGVYFIKMDVGGRSLTRKCVIVR